MGIMETSTIILNSLLHVQLLVTDIREVIFFLNVNANCAVKDDI